MVRPQIFSQTLIAPSPRPGGTGQEELPHAPTPEARVGGREDQPHVQEGLEELFHVEGQEGRQ